MPRSKLFEYAILYHPKVKRDAAGNELDGVKSVLIKDLTAQLAVSDKEVAMLAAKAIPTEYEDRLEDIEILIRPLSP